MPRLPPSLLRRAHATSPHLAALLPVCRDLSSASNELRWIRQHVATMHPVSQRPAASDAAVARLCARRAQGYPLQYILGSQPFGTLDIRCQPGVLIPRPETEAWVYHLSEAIRSHKRSIRPLRIVDFCTGTGCIPLLLASLLHHDFPQLEAWGFDLSPQAVALSRRNLVLNREYINSPGNNKVQPVHFEEEDIFEDRWKQLLKQSRGSEMQVDVLVSNPPYISAEEFNRDTERSVRKFEPRLALVPGLQLSSAFPHARPEDVFYARLVQIAAELRPRIALFEVGDLQQAVRVVEMVAEYDCWQTIEIWKDWPDMTPGPDEASTVSAGRTSVPVRGSGNGRAVFLQSTLHDNSRGHQ